MADKTFRPLREVVEEHPELDAKWLIISRVDRLAKQLKALEERLNERVHCYCGRTMLLSDHHCLYCGQVNKHAEHLKPAPVREPAEPAPDKPDFSEIAKKHYSDWMRREPADGGRTIDLPDVIRRACEEAAEQATAELTRKGKKLCEAHGNLLMEAHELNAELARLQAAAVPSKDEIKNWLADFVQEDSPYVVTHNSWLLANELHLRLKRRVEEAIGKEAGDAE